MLEATLTTNQRPLTGQFITWIKYLLWTSKATRWNFLVYMQGALVNSIVPPQKVGQFQRLIQFYSMYLDYI